MLPTFILYANCCQDTSGLIQLTDSTKFVFRRIKVQQLWNTNPKIVSEILDPYLFTDSYTY